MRRSGLLLGAAACAACASGGQGGGDPSVDASAATPDSRMVTLDAAPVDGGPQTRTLTQTTSQMIKPATSIACPNSPGTGANNYYRVFDLAAYGITSAFTVSQVSFQVEHCDKINGSTGTVVAVRVGTYAGMPGTTLALADMTILASNPTVMVPEVIEDLGPPATTPGGTVHAPITATIPAGQKLFVEVDAPDGRNNYYFYMGANDAGEQGFGYILAPGCNVSVPTNISTVSTMYPNVHLLLTVTGTH